MITEAVVGRIEVAAFDHFQCEVQQFENIQFVIKIHYKGLCFTPNAPKWFIYFIV
jgi:hypothetical protein